MARHESEDDWEDASAPPADYLERVQGGAELTKAGRSKNENGKRILENLGSSRDTVSEV